MGYISTALKTIKNTLKQLHCIAEVTLAQTRKKNLVKNRYL